jgi:hypothetical protein
MALTTHTHNELLELFFKYFSSWALRVVPTLFRRDMYLVLNTVTPVRVEHYSPMLVWVSTNVR